MRTKLVIITLALIAMEGVVFIFKNLSQSKELDGLEHRVSASAYLRQKIGALREINSEVPIDAFKMLYSSMIGLQKMGSFLYI
jgi:hypothetical protein